MDSRKVATNIWKVHNGKLKSPPLSLSFVFTRLSLSMSMYRSMFDVDLVISVVSFIQWNVCDQHSYQTYYYSVKTHQLYGGS